MIIEFDWLPLAVIRRALRASVAAHGLAATVQMLAEVADEGNAAPQPILAEHGRRIARLERRLTTEGASYE